MIRRILILLAALALLAALFTLYIKLRTTVPPMDPPPEHNYSQGAE